MMANFRLALLRWCEQRKQAGHFWWFGLVGTFVTKRITYTGKKDEQQVKNPEASQHEKLSFIFFQFFVFYSRAT